MQNQFRALGIRNYRLFFAGELVSMVGTWMQSVVQAWLVYRMSHSALWLGIIAFCGHFASFLVSPIAGVLADIHDRRKILIGVATAGMIQALLLAALCFSGKVELWHIAALSVVLGVCNSFEIITRHSFAIDLVGRADLASAISLNSIIINGSRILGPALAGLLISQVSEGTCFLINGLSYIAVIYSLMAMNRQKILRRLQVHPPGVAQLVDDFKQAVRYLKTEPAILRLMSVSAFISFVGFPIGNFFPAFAQDVLHGDASTLAWLTGLAGVGAITGSLILIGLGSRRVNGSIQCIVAACMFLASVALITMGLSRQVNLSLVACFLMGLTMIGVMPLLNSRLQHRVDDSMRGRVLSLYTMSFLGATPIGSLLQGWAADRWGAGPVTCAAGGGFFVFSMFVWLRVYVRTTRVTPRENVHV